MTTQRPGGRIHGKIALTMKCTYAAALGDHVHITGDYQCALADGTKPVLGYVSVKNVKRVSTATSDTFPVGDVNGDVTVEALGFHVVMKLSGAAITAGTLVGIGAAGTIVPAGANVSNVGLALTGAGAAGVAIDILGRTS